MHIVHFAEIDSTSTYAKTHAASLPDLTFDTASYQSEGKGRQGRTWKAEKDENLLYSLFIKNGPMVQAGPFLSLVAAVSLSEVLERDYKLAASIKWPNDVYIDGRKIAGILLEGIGAECLIIGMGVNVNQLSFDGEYRISPTSLALCLGEKVDLDTFQQRLFAQLLANLEEHAAKNRFLAYYREHDYLRDKKVSYEGKEYIVKGVDAEFSLLLKNETEERHIVSGEISFL